MNMNEHVYICEKRRRNNETKENICTSPDNMNKDLQYKLHDHHLIIIMPLTHSQDRITHVAITITTNHHGKKDQKIFQEI